MRRAYEWMPTGARISRRNNAAIPMQKNSTSQSGLFNPRALLAFALWLASVFLAMVSFAAPSPSTQLPGVQGAFLAITQSPNLFPHILPPLLSPPARAAAAASAPVPAIAPGFQYQVLHEFLLPPENPDAALIQGSDGNFYGTTEYGGTAGSGTVFKMDASGAVTTLHSFAGSDGTLPFAVLIQGSDGNFYGTTYGGGANNDGTAFK